MTIHNNSHSHSHSHYSHILSQHSPSHSPSHSPKSVTRRSLSTTDDDISFAYDFPQYTYVPPSSSVVDPLSPSSTDALVPPSASGSNARSKQPVSRRAFSPSRNRGHNNHQDQDPSCRDGEAYSPSSASTSTPPVSGRFFHNSHPSNSLSLNLSTAPIYPSSSSSAAFTSNNANSSPSRARGPSFASTTTTSSTSTASSASSSGAPATPPRNHHPLAYVTSPTTTMGSTRVFRPYWERSHPLGAPATGDEDECRLDEEAEDQLREKEMRENVLADHGEVEEEDTSTDEEYEYDPRRNSSASGEVARYLSYLTPPSASTITSSTRKPHLQPGRPRSIRRSPFADDDPAQPYNYSHVYLDEDVPQSVSTRRFSGSAAPSVTTARRRMTDSPRSVARSASLNHGHGRASPRRVNSPIMMNSLSGFGGSNGSGSRPQSPALSVHSNSHSPAHSSTPLTANVNGGSSNGSTNSPSPARPALPLRETSHTPSLNLPDPSPEVDASPLRTALLLNPDPDLSLTRTHSGQSSERRFSSGGRGLGSSLGGGYSGGLGLHGMGPGAGGAGGSGSGGMGAGSINAALARRRAEWTEFEGDEFSVSGYDARKAEERESASRRSSRYGFGYGGYGYGLNLDDGRTREEDDGVDEGAADEVDGREDERRAHVDLSSPRPSFSSPLAHPYARVSSPLASDNQNAKRSSIIGSGGRRSSSQTRGGVSYTYAYGFSSRQQQPSDSRDEDLLSERPSSSQLSTRISVGNANANADSNNDNKNNNNKRDKEKSEGEDGGVTTCFAFKWSLRARWAALKLRVRLGAFRAKRRVGLV